LAYTTNRKNRECNELHDSEMADGLIKMYAIALLSKQNKRMTA
jgi:hypothetical protein